MQTTEDQIRTGRDARSSGILVTGVTGFLGSHLMAELLKKGYPVIALCRPKGDLGAAERMGRLLKWFGIGVEETRRLEVVEAFVDQPQLGLSNEKYARLLEQTDEVLHCAADTSFAERRRVRVEIVNVKGLANVLNMALAGNCRFFHYMSTAYVAGRRTGYCPEAFVDTHDFTNVYEETKNRGEKRVIEACRKGGLRCNIYRPSIVYGDSVTGKTLRFNALYYPVKTAQYFKNLYLDDILHNEGKNAKKMGVRVKDDGTVYLPIRIEKEESGRLNVIPVDFFVEACMAIMEESLEGDIFHIVNKNPKSLDDLVDYTQRFFNITGIRAVEQSEFNKTARNALEILAAGYIDIYQPYMQDTRVFGSEKADVILTRRGIRCPGFDYGIFERCITYAMEVDWGNRLYEEGVLVSRRHPLSPSGIL